MPGPKIDPLLSATIRHRDGGRCLYCGRKVEGDEVLTVDHLVPRVWWSLATLPTMDDPTNLGSACELCNSLKGAMDVEAFASMLDIYGANLSGRYEYLASVLGADVRARVEAAIAKPLDHAAGRDALATLRANSRR